MPRSDRILRMLDPGKRQFMRVHVRDLLSSMTWNASDATSRGIYASLLFHSFLAPEGILEFDENQLQTICKCTENEWNAAWPRIKKKFTERSGGVCNPRVRKEIAHQLRKSASARRSIEKRWGYERNTKGIPRTRARAGSGSSSSSSSVQGRESTRTYGKGRTGKTAPGVTPDQVAELFARILPELPRPRLPLKPGIKNAVKAAITRDGSETESWVAYFSSIRKLDFLMGRKSDWRASLLWILGPKNRAKIESGAYENHQKPGGGSLAGMNYELGFDDVV